MAEAVLREELERAGLSGAVAVDSAGTGDWHVGERMYGPAADELARRGYDGSAHRARQIEPSWLAGYDLLLAMDLDNLADLRRMAAGSGAAGRVRLLRSFDPALSDGDPYPAPVPDPPGGRQPAGGPPALHDVGGVEEPVSSIHLRAHAAPHPTARHSRGPELGAEPPDTN